MKKKDREGRKNLLQVKIGNIHLASIHCPQFSFSALICLRGMVQNNSLHSAQGHSSE